MSITEIIWKVAIESGVKGAVWIGRKAYENLIANNRTEQIEEPKRQLNDNKNAEFISPLEEDIVIPPTEALKLPHMKEKVLVGKGGEMDGCLYLLHHTPISIGRDPAQCNIIYPPEAKGISRLHCQLIQEGENWLLVDFSSYGTWMQNKRLEKGRSYPLKPGDDFFLASKKDGFVFQEVTL